MIITQLRKASYELGYAEGRIEALKDLMNTSHYNDVSEVRAVLGISPDTKAQETKDDLADALAYTE